MKKVERRTKIVATIGPASCSREVLRELIVAGMDVARLNFSHGTPNGYDEVIKHIRDISRELDCATTILQDLQGPKIRVSSLPEDGIELKKGEILTIIPIEDDYKYVPGKIGIDYKHLAKDAKPGTQILLDDGMLELVVKDVQGEEIKCEIVQGGVLKSKKGVNLPDIDLKVPSMTEKDKKDLEFGVSRGVDWVSLSFVRRVEDILDLRNELKRLGKNIPVMAKIEKPQAIENLESIIRECDGIMVARGDLGVEMKEEIIPRLQKRIIEMCNKMGKPVITATQMLESMVKNPRPTRAEVSDIANAIIEGTDAIMLSAESAAGQYPVKSVETMSRIALDVESYAKFVNYPPADSNDTHALCEALNTIDKIIPLRCICAFTSSGYTAGLAASERPRAVVYAFTPHESTYHALNLHWGIIPLFLDHEVESFEDLTLQAETTLKSRNLAGPGDRVLIIGGIPTKKTRGTNFLKIHTIPEM